MPNSAPELVEFITENDGSSRMVLNLHPGQTEAWDSEARVVAVSAGSQGGKTSFGPHWLNREIDRRGSGDYIAATSSYDLFKLKMLPALIDLFERDLHRGRYWAGDRIIELADPTTGLFWAKRAIDPMWGRIILRSAGSKGGLESATAKGAWLDEVGQDEFTLDAYQAVERRLTIHQGRILITTTLYNIGWFLQKIVQKNDGKKVHVVHFPSYFNPKFDRAEFEEKRLSMPEWKFRMFYEGLAARPPGLIYGDFHNELISKGGHKYRPFAIPRLWPRWMGGDPGAVNFCKVWVAKDIADSSLYVYRESLESGKSTRQLAHGARDLAAANNEKVVKYFIGQPAERQIRTDWADAGIHNVGVAKVTGVEAQIDTVIEQFKLWKLFISEECEGTLDQLGRYSRMLDDNGDPIDKIDEKQKYHYLDALRYVINGIIRGARRKTELGAKPVALQQLEEDYE